MFTVIKESGKGFCLILQESLTNVPQCGGRDLHGRPGSNHFDWEGSWLYLIVKKLDMLYAGMGRGR